MKQTPKKERNEPTKDSHFRKLILLSSVIALILILSIFAPNNKTIEILGIGAIAIFILFEVLCFAAIIFRNFTPTKR